MKKCIACIATLSLILAMAGCNSKKETEKSWTPPSGTGEETTAETTPEETTAEETTSEETTTAAESSETSADASESSADASETSADASESSAAEGKVLSYAAYKAAALDTDVTIEAYVQAKQSWWDNKATVYLQDEDGAYFAYNMACSEADYAKLTEGQKIRVSGVKSEWSGEVEISDGSFEVIDGTWVATPVDVTADLGTDALIDKQNLKVSFTGMKVEASKDADGKEVAFLYNWDGSGAEGDDLYFQVSVNDKTYSFVVESYLCGKDTEVYKTVQGLKVGDTVDMEGFLYWYEGANPHITKVTVK